MELAIGKASQSGSGTGGQVEEQVWLPISAERSYMWRAWQKYARDPDEHLHIWAVSGAPLGMDAEIPDSGGVFPPVEEESEQAQLAPEHGQL